jgi:hypothetical protein
MIVNMSMIRTTPQVAFIFSLLATLSSIVGCEGTNVNPDNPIIKDDNPVVYVDKLCSTCDHVINLDNDWYFDGIEQGVQPGDTIGIQGGGENSVERILNIIGTPENPVVLINCDGQVLFESSQRYALQIRDSKYFVLAGTGDKASKYGFRLGTDHQPSSALVVGPLCTDFEVSSIEVFKSGFAGILSKTDANCDGSISRSTFTQFNTVIHHTYIHDTGGEGMYIGSTSWPSGYTGNSSCPGTVLWESELKGVRIYSNLVERSGWDGIQVSSAVEDCKIYNNIVRDYAVAREEYHINGIQLGGGTTGECFNNLVIGGNGYALFNFGRGDNYIYNNVLVNSKRDAVAVASRNPTPGLGYYFINNTIINPGDNGFIIYDDETTGSVYYNNIIVNPGKEYFAKDGLDVANNYLTISIEELMFENPDQLNFMLKAGSPVIDFGKDVSDYGINIDFNNNERPIGAYDAGAFEFK